jgi:hypothetical protein
MAVDYCSDCKGRFPGGKGLKGGRCPACLDAFKQRRAEARKGPEPEPEEQEE